MEDVFNRFKELFEQRFQRVLVTNMGEDSVRYDFFLALQEVMSLNSPATARNRRFDEVNPFPRYRANPFAWYI